MIKLQNISKSFPNTDCLRNVNLEVADGEFVCIMGPSGSGKTTLLNIIGLLDAPNEGNCMIDGKDVYKLTDKERTIYRREHLGFIFQAYNLIDEMTIGENVELPLKLLGMPRNMYKSKTRDILRELGISHRLNMYPAEISGGQQQRAAIARAVIAHPKLILADEPTGNLDSKQGQEVMELLCKLHKQLGITIIMVTHNRRDADYADRIVELFDGRIVSSGTQVQN